MKFGQCMGTLGVMGVVCLAMNSYYRTLTHRYKAQPMQLRTKKVMQKCVRQAFESITWGCESQPL